MPAGTIHAIGAGLVLAEIQQRVDATFRLFDYGRQRPLHAAHAVAVADSRPAAAQRQSTRISSEREVLAANPYFVFERLSLPALSHWLIDAERETWLLVLHGNAKAGTLNIAQGDALFAQADRISIRTAAEDLVCLIAYTGVGGIEPQLLNRAPDISFNNFAAANGLTISL